MLFSRAECHGAPARSPETDAIYFAVMYLRSIGRRVYRSGPKFHLVDGKRVSTWRLTQLGGTQYLWNSPARAAADGSKSAATEKERSNESENAGRR